MAPNEVRALIAGFITRTFGPLEHHPHVKLPTVQFWVGDVPYLITVTGGTEHGDWPGALSKDPPKPGDTFRDADGTVACWPVQGGM